MEGPLTALNAFSYSQLKKEVERRERVAYQSATKELRALLQDDGAVFSDIKRSPAVRSKAHAIEKFDHATGKYHVGAFRMNMYYPVVETRETFEAAVKKENHKSDKYLLFLVNHWEAICDIHKKYLMQFT